MAFHINTRSRKYNVCLWEKESGEYRLRVVVCTEGGGGGGGDFCSVYIAFKNERRSKSGKKLWENFRFSIKNRKKSWLNAKKL